MQLVCRLTAVLASKTDKTVRTRFDSCGTNVHIHHQDDIDSNVPNTKDQSECCQWSFTTKDADQQIARDPASTIVTGDPQSLRMYCWKGSQCITRQLVQSQWLHFLMYLLTAPGDNDKAGAMTA